jgi:hypothetical protein
MARRQPSTPEQNIVETILQTLWALFTLPFKNRTKGLDSGTAALLSSHWHGVSEFMRSPETEAMAISEADKLLDAALQAIELPGNNMGERLRAAEARWGRDFSNRVWRAHKLRNQIAHEVGITLAPGQANMAVNTFREALKRLGVPL